MPPSSEFAAVTDYLFGQKARGVKFGIDRMRVLADALGHPERALRTFHVAGTNGKGSVAAMIAAILQAAGWRTGLYTSPHLVHVGERVQVNGRRLTDDEIIAYVHELRPIAEELGRGNAEEQPSFFEFMTAMAFLQFTRQHCDIASIEVGLGGRLDATNILLPEVCVITSIGHDHCEILGHDLEQIAAEKAGIIKPGRPVVMGRMPAAAENAIRRVAAANGAPVVSVAERYGDPAALPETNLEGEHQRWNAATAVEAVRLLGPEWRITPEAVRQGLGHIHWPGRWQRVRLGKRLLILDASHNPEGAATLEAGLNKLVAETGRAPIAIVGVLGAERARPLIEVLCRHARALHLVAPKQARASSREELAGFVPPSFKGTVVMDEVERLFPAPGTCNAGEDDDIIVVTGSIYLLGEVMTRMGDCGATPS